MTGDDFREMALGLEGAVEQSHMGHPDFRVNGRIFATLTADERDGMAVLPAAEQKHLIDEDPTAFRPAAGAWGRQGCTMILLSKANKRDVRGALLLAWQYAMQKGPTRAKRRKR